MPGRGWGVAGMRPGRGCDLIGDDALLDVSELLGEALEPLLLLLHRSLWSRRIVHMISANCTHDLGELYIRSRRIGHNFSANQAYHLATYGAQQIVHTISANCTYDLGELYIVV